MPQHRVSALLLFSENPVTHRFPVAARHCNAPTKTSVAKVYDIAIQLYQQSS
jgi:hypothetical protein